MDPDGTYFRDPSTGESVFVPFGMLHEACKDMVVNGPEPEWKSDPTYNLRRKR